MKFSYGAVWDDTMQMLGANASVLLSVAGAFFLLPALFLAMVAPQPQGAQTIAQMMNDLSAYYAANWHWMLLANLVNMVGAIAILLLLLNAGRVTVGNALGSAVGLLPFYFLLSILTGVIIGFGFVWLILPGIYLLGRLMVSNAVMVAEGRRNPFDAIGSSWRLTKGKGWAVAGLLVVVGIAAYIVISAITFVLGSVLILIGGRDGIGGLLTTLLIGVLSTAFSTLLVVLLAAIYRRLAPAEASPAGPAY